MEKHTEEEKGGGAARRHVAGALFGLIALGFLAGTLVLFGGEAENAAGWVLAYVFPAIMAPIAYGYLLACLFFLMRTRRSGRVTRAAITSDGAVVSLDGLHKEKVFAAGQKYYWAYLLGAFAAFIAGVFMAAGGVSTIILQSAFDARTEGTVIESTFVDDLSAHCTTVEYFVNEQRYTYKSQTKSEIFKVTAGIEGDEFIGKMTIYFNSKDPWNASHTKSVDTETFLLLVCGGLFILTSIGASIVGVRLKKAGGV